MKTVARELLQLRLSALSTPGYATDSEEPARKCPHTAQCFSEILQDTGASVSAHSGNCQVPLRAPNCVPIV